MLCSKIGNRVGNGEAALAAIKSDWLEEKHG